jgi:dihydroxy-acid dehydratase
VTGKSLAENVSGAEIQNPDVIHTLDNPLNDEGGIAVLYGNLAPDGAVIKHVAATPGLLHHKGRAVVLGDLEDLKRINDPDLDVTKDNVLVLRNVGPVGGIGMPEVGNFPIPEKLLRQGVRDMVRISDGRMSGTAFGTIVLHAAPESAVGGPLALVKDGDWIELDVGRRSLNLLIDKGELAERRAAWEAGPIAFRRGYRRLYLEHVNQAPLGCDFDFLLGRDPVRAEEQPKF